MFKELTMKLLHIIHLLCMQTLNISQGKLHLSLIQKIKCLHSRNTECVSIKVKQGRLGIIEPGTFILKFTNCFLSRTA